MSYYVLGDFVEKKMRYRKRFDVRPSVFVFSNSRIIHQGGGGNQDR